jgi:LL-diaminopimelate aminotransferase
MQRTINFYKENTQIIMDISPSLGLVFMAAKMRRTCGFTSLAGDHGMCLQKSWKRLMWSRVTTPGWGFGPGGEGFVRVSAFGHRENVLEASRRVSQLYK